MVRMRSKYSKVSLFLVFSIVEMLLGGYVYSETNPPKQETITQIIKDITPKEAFTLIQNNKDNPDFVILDVRTPEEFTEGHIRDAVNLDFYSETFGEGLNKLDKKKTYLIHCASGDRSGKTLNIMKELKYREVYNMLGGIIKWKSEKLPTTKDTQ